VFISIDEKNIFTINFIVVLILKLKTMLLISFTDKYQIADLKI
tara:strand:- start:487 stop:615 length:129 start_codon:yes stop_codon:yes gene_type:complete